MARITEDRSFQYFIPNDADGAWVQIRYLKPGERTDLETKANDVSAVSDEDGNLRTTVNFDILKKKKLFFSLAIIAWGNFFGLAGKPMPLSINNLLLFDKEIKDFYSNIREASAEFNAKIDEELENEADPN